MTVDNTNFVSRQKFNILNYLFWFFIYGVLIAKWISMRLHNSYEYKSHVEMILIIVIATCFICLIMLLNISGLGTYTFTLTSSHIKVDFSSMWSEHSNVYRWDRIQYIEFSRRCSPNTSMSIKFKPQNKFSTRYGVIRSSSPNGIKTPLTAEQQNTIHQFHNTYGVCNSQHTNDLKEADEVLKSKSE